MRSAATASEQPTPCVRIPGRDSPFRQPGDTEQLSRMPTRRHLPATMPGWLIWRSMLPISKCAIFAMRGASANDEPRCTCKDGMRAATLLTGFTFAAKATGLPWFAWLLTADCCRSGRSFLHQPNAKWGWLLREDRPLARRVHSRAGGPGLLARTARSSPSSPLEPARPGAASSQPGALSQDGSSPVAQPQAAELSAHAGGLCRRWWDCLLPLSLRLPLRGGPRPFWSLRHLLCLGLASAVAGAWRGRLALLIARSWSARVRRPPRWCAGGRHPGPRGSRPNRPYGGGRSYRPRGSRRWALSREWRRTPGSAAVPRQKTWRRRSPAASPRCVQRGRVNRDFSRTATWTW